MEYFAHWYHHQHVLFEAHEHYQKRSWRNRSCILSPTLPLILTVPLRKGKHQQLPIRDVLISYDEPWMHQHVHSLKTAYGKTAFADEVLESLIPVLEFGYESLWYLNMACLDIIFSLMPGTFTYEVTKVYVPPAKNDLIDLRKGVPAGHSTLLDIDIPTYTQVNRLHLSFLPNLSILDVLCHLGPETLNYVSTYAARLYPTI